MVLPCRQRRAGLKHSGWPMKICKEEATVVWVPNDNFLILYFNYNLYKKIKINTIIFYINYELSLSSSIDLPEAIVPSLLIPIYRRQHLERSPCALLPSTAPQNSDTVISTMRLVDTGEKEKSSWSSLASDSSPAVGLGRTTWKPCGGRRCPIRWRPSCCVGFGLSWFPLRSGWLKGWIFFFLSSYLSVTTLLFPYCFGEEELFAINILCF